MYIFTGSTFSHVETGGEHDVALEKFDGVAEFVLEVGVANVLGSLAQLPQHFL